MHTLGGDARPKRVPYSSSEDPATLNVAATKVNTIGFVLARCHYGGIQWQPIKYIHIWFVELRLIAESNTLYPTFYK